MNTITPEVYNTIHRALERYRGDDYERAKAAFRDMTPSEMQEQYGFSGKTRQQILDGYREHVENVQAAINWMERI